MDYSQIDSYLERKLNENLQELIQLCKIPSISAQNKCLNEGAEFVAEMLKKRGFQTEIHQTQGAPIVYAERKGNSDKTILFYNHYDVQPPEPLDLWDSPPFDPVQRDGKLFARGVSDDKGHITSRIFAIDSILDTFGELPCNIKFVIEGEEETSSKNIPPFVKANAEKLSADGCIWEFGTVNHLEIPQQILGLRGICYVQLTAKTASTDTHSGVGGTIFPNAAWRLIWALSSLKDANENVKIPGFYENVLPPSEKDFELFGKLANPAEDYKKRYGVKSFLKGVEGGIDLMIQEVFEPSCTICGLTSGYQGSGSKTVLPAEASAKVDFRLVPNQTPEEILEKLREHLDNEGFEDVEIEYLGGESPGRTDPEDPFVQIVIDAADGVYSAPMDIVPMVGGSGPNHIFLQALGVPIVTAGVGYSGSKAHAPNENIRLDLYLKGAKHIARILMNFSKS